MNPTTKLKKAVQLFADREGPTPVGSVAAIYTRFARELADEIATLQVVRGQLVEMARRTTKWGRGQTLDEPLTRKVAASSNGGKSQRELALMVMRRAKRPMTTREIVDGVLKAGAVTTSNNFRGVIGVALGSLVKAGEVKVHRKRKGVAGNRWGLR